MKLHSFIATAAVLVGALWSQASYANTAGFSIWENAYPNNGSDPANIANIPSGTPNLTGTFTVDPLDLSVFTGGNNSINAFLTSNGSTYTPITGDFSDTNQNTFWEITGVVTVTHDELFSVTHDDGASLYIDSEKIFQSGAPTVAKMSSGTFTGASGNYDFTLIYGQCCGLPAVLQTDLPFTPLAATTPLPATLPLLATGLGFFGFLSRRKKGKSAAAAFA